MHEDDLYQILQVDPEAEPDVISAAYRVLAGRLHPDRDISGVDDYRMAELNRAYAVLRDPQRRRDYDQRSQGGRGDTDRVAVGPGHPGRGLGGGPLARRLRSRDADEFGAVRVDFGRYEGWSLADILSADPDYLRWLSRHSSGVRYRGAILRLLAEREQRAPVHHPG